MKRFMHGMTCVFLPITACATFLQKALASGLCSTCRTVFSSMECDGAGLSGSSVSLPLNFSGECFFFLDWLALLHPPLYGIWLAFCFFRCSHESSVFATETTHRKRFCVVALTRLWFVVLVRQPQKQYVPLQRFFSCSCVPCTMF